MPAEFINFIAKYGYAFIFLLVFIQEIGIPTFPNELALLYFGYAAFKGVLNIALVFASAVSADIAGTCLVYILFYFFSAFLKSHKPKWIPVPVRALNYLQEKIRNRKFKNIFIGRLIPYLRGYTSVVCGALHVHPRFYVSMVLISAIIWSGGYVMLGYFAGPYWNIISPKLGAFSNILILIPAAFAIWLIINFLIKRKIANSK